ncbi:hypothetical protein B6S59_07105 [Pseudomonas sp. A46]|nr:hypothetical protein B6S59_07105 [Pseudomonas sp. A46]
MRPSFASHFIMKGGALLTLQRIQGHTTEGMAMRYAHLAPDHWLDVVRLGLPKTFDTSRHFAETRKQKPLKLQEFQGLRL